MKKLMIILLLLSGMVTTSVAQNLKQMSEKDRNEKLVQVAKEAIQKYAPDYYRYTSGKYTITLIDKNSRGEKMREYFKVRFIDYNKDEEHFANGHPINVEIWVDNGIARAVTNGQGWGILIPGQPLTRGEQVPKLEYKRVPPYRPNPDGSHNM